MIDLVKNHLQSIYKEALEDSRIYNIYNVFIEQFGEEYVDWDIPSFEEWLQKLECTYKIPDDFPTQNIDIYSENKTKYLDLLSLLESHFIIVHFPKVRVTNEYNKYIDIQDLWVKIKITPRGCLEDLKLCKSTFSYEQFIVGYVHSHVSSLPPNNIGTWQTPCLGTGPISNTKRTLTTNYDINIWGLFAYELSKYVCIESIAGGPYIRLENVHKGNVIEGLSHFTLMDKSRSVISGLPISTSILLEHFIQYHAKNHRFKLKFVNGQYVLGESTVSFMINISNSFIEFLNTKDTEMMIFPSFKILLKNKILLPYIVLNGKIYNTPRGNVTSTDIERYNNKILFYFKNKPVFVQIENKIMDYNSNISYLLRKECCEYIATKILTIINYRYGKKQNSIRKTYIESELLDADIKEKLCFI